MLLFMMLLSSQIQLPSFVAILLMIGKKNRSIYTSEVEGDIDSQPACSLTVPESCWKHALSFGF